LSDQVREILLVDDDPGFVATLSALLKHAGYDVVAEVAFDSALAYLASHRPDLLITDLHLEQRSGWELVDYARKHQPGLPVVVVTGFVDEWQDVAWRLGTPVFLKPFDPDGLLTFLRQQFGTPT
jgi:DNA-binding response OmpR family regulator